MTTPWKSTINKIQDGESVSASTAGRPTDSLSQRTQHLKDRLDNALLGQALIEVEAPLESASIVGQAVYKDIDGIWKRSLAEVAKDTVLGYFVLKTSARVQGLVLSKTSATLGTVLLSGRMTNIDWSAAVDGTYAHGQYYLSGQNAGQLTMAKPAVGIPVAVIIPEKQEVYVNTATRDVLEDHVHFQVDLESAPAGVPACSLSLGDTHTIYQVDTASMGWLPASDPIFNSNAPTGAVFGYNLAAHTDLSQVWPPVPLESVHIEVDGVGVPIAIDNGVPPNAKVVVNRYGIWWMEGCYGGAPWADPYPICTPDAGASTIAPFGGDYYYFPPPGCPEPYRRKLVLYFSKMVYKTNANVVTQLTAKSGSSITLVDPNGVPASTGDLTIDIPINFTITENTAGHQVLKDINGLAFTRGPVLESVRAADSSVTITGGTTPDSQGRVYGDVAIALSDPTVAGRDLSIQLIGLSQATEEIYNDVLFMGLPASVDSTIRLKTIVAENALTGAGTLKLKLWIFGSLAGTLPELSWSYRIVSAPGTSGTSIPISDSIVGTGLFTPTASGPYIYNQIETGVIPGISAGDIIFITIKRSASGVGDGYTGLVGLLKIVPVLAAV